ncbi:MAG: nicotinate phosphoribosyltransferase [Gaiellales bacterium]
MGSASGPGLFTDLYELKMVQAYLAEGMTATAVFELFFRDLPPGRNFVLAAGLDDVLDYLEDLRFGPEELDWLAHEGLVSDEALVGLARLRFTGDVWAVPEGTVVFPNEPLVQVVAPVAEAQLVETFVMNQVHVQSVIATKAARLVLAAEGTPVVDFGSRRTHGVDAAIKVARASYLAGAVGTSNVLGSYRYGMPAVGTMAHSYVQAHDGDLDAFSAFTRSFPDTTLLVDTYDTLEGVDAVVDLAERLGERFRVSAIRLDSGDLEALSRAARRRLDAAGLGAVEIFASGGLDEYRIRSLVRGDAPIDGFGVGTELSVSRDAPALELVYKLVEYDGVPRFKRSARKQLLPGRKQVTRVARDGTFAHDVVGLFDEPADGESLLHEAMRAGRRTPAGGATLTDARVRAASQLCALPEHLRELDDASPPFQVTTSPGLEQLREAVCP